MCHFSAILSKPKENFEQVKLKQFISSETAYFLVSEDEIDVNIFVWHEQHQGGALVARSGCPAAAMHKGGR